MKIEFGKNYKFIFQTNGIQHASTIEPELKDGKYVPTSFCRALFPTLQHIQEGVLYDIEGNEVPNLPDLREGDLIIVGAERFARRFSHWYQGKLYCVSNTKLPGVSRWDKYEIPPETQAKIYARSGKLTPQKGDVVVVEDPSGNRFVRVFSHFSDGPMCLDNGHIDPVTATRWSKIISIVGRVEL